MAVFHRRWLNMHYCHCILLCDARFPCHSGFMAHTWWTNSGSEKDGRRYVQLRTETRTVIWPCRCSHRLDSVVARNRRVLLKCCGIIHTFFPYYIGHHGIRFNSVPFTLCSSLVCWRYSIILHRAVRSSTHDSALFRSFDIWHRHSDITRDRFWHIAGLVSVGMMGFIIAISTMRTSLRYLSLWVEELVPTCPYLITSIGSSWLNRTCHTWSLWHGWAILCRNHLPSERSVWHFLICSQLSDTWVDRECSEPPRTI